MGGCVLGSWIWCQPVDAWDCCWHSWLQCLGCPKPTGEWNWIPVWLALWLCGSRSWCQPAGGHCQGSGFPWASASILMCETRSWSIWLQVSGCSEAVVSLLVGETQSWSGWLRFPMCPRTGIDLLVGKARIQGISGLVPACWWVSWVLTCHTAVALHLVSNCW